MQYRFGLPCEVWCWPEDGRTQDTQAVIADALHDAARIPGDVVARYRVGLETRERIINATRGLLSRMGLDALTLKAITDEAGVGAGSFYNLFASKDEVIFEVIREAIAAVDPDPSGAGGESLDQLVAAFVTFVVDDPTIARIYLRMAVGRGLVDPTIAERVVRAHERRLGRFADAWRRDDPGLSAAKARTRAEMMLAGLTGLALNALLDGRFDLLVHATQLLCQMRGDRPLATVANSVSSRSESPRLSGNRAPRSTSA